MKRVISQGEPSFGLSVKYDEGHPVERDEIRGIRRIK
jgi:hypothetical protein